MPARGQRGGVDIIQNCEVTGIRRAPTGEVTGVETERGFIGAKKVGVVAAGHTSVVMKMAGVRLPLHSHPLQALVSEPVKPVFPCVVMSNTVHAYISQSDKGELVIGAGTDQYASYSQTGAAHIITHTLDAICELFPMFRRMRMLRTWGGIVDVTPDRSPIVAKTPFPGSTSTAAGAPAASRRRRARATSSLTRSRVTSPTRSTPHLRWSASAPALIDEAAAAAVAH
jgi:sarcosine oxidase subunit beta